MQSTGNEGLTVERREAHATEMAAIREELSKLSEERLAVMAELGEFYYGKVREDAASQAGAEELFYALADIDHRKQEEGLRLERLEAEEASWGEPTVIGHCHACGAWITDYDVRCIVCGAPVDNREIASAEGADAAPVMQPDVTIPSPVDVDMTEPGEGEPHPMGAPSGELADITVSPEEAAEMEEIADVLVEVALEPSPSDGATEESTPFLDGTPTQDSPHEAVPRRCPMCGAPVKPEYQFCMECGARLGI